MAYVSGIPDQQQNQFAPSGTTTPNPLAMMPPQATQTGGSVGQGGGAQGTTAPGGATSTQFGNNAAKLSDYLSANADQTGALGSQIAGQLNQGFNTVQGDVGNAVQGQLNAVNSGYTPYDANAMAQLQANPAQFASNPQNVKQFQNLWNDQYTGPTNFESTPAYSNIQNEVQNAVSNANLLNTYPGVSTYLNNQAKGTYTPGMNTLDTALLTGSAPAYAQVTQAAAPYAGLNNYLTNQAATADAAIPAAQQAAANAAQQTQGAFNTAVGNLNTNVANETAAAEAQRTAYNNQLAQDMANLQGGQLAGTGAPANLNKFLTQYLQPFETSATQPTWSSPWGALNFANADTNQMDVAAATPAQVASAQDYANAGGLQALIQGLNASPNLQINPANASQAGTWQAPTMQPLNGQAIGQDMYNSLDSGGLYNGSAGDKAYTNYQQLQDALQFYLGTLRPTSTDGQGHTIYGAPVTTDAQLQALYPGVVDINNLGPGMV